MFRSSWATLPPWSAAPPPWCNHYNVQPVLDVYANVRTATWAAWPAMWTRSSKSAAQAAARLSHPDPRARWKPCGLRSLGLAGGLILAVSLVYLLMVVNFQIVAGSVHHPDGAAGRALRHRLDARRHADHDQRPVADGRHHEHRRGHREQHPAGHLRQSICARKARRRGAAALTAGGHAAAAGVMTAGAMIIGMLPMALGLGEGGEQNAPLGRAVIGGFCWRPSPRCSLSPSFIACCAAELGRSRWKKTRSCSYETRR